MSYFYNRWYMENETPQIGKFKASRLLFNESLRLLKQDTEILLFPFYSLIFSLIALINDN